MDSAAGTSLVVDVPDECLVSVFRRLPSHSDRNAVALTCRLWRALEALSRHTLRFVCDERSTLLPNEAEFLLDRLVYALRTFPQIHRIIISRYSRLPDSFFQFFENRCFAQLTTLHLHFCLNITDKSVEYLAAGCPSLTQLTLTCCICIGDEGLCALARGASQLQHLDVSYCGLVTDEGIDVVIKSCPNMQEISFSYCYNVQGWGLRNGRNLKKVQAEACKLTDAGLVEGLQGAIAIQVLNMADLRSSFRLGPSGLGQLGTSSEMIQVLCLRMCRMLDDATVKKIAQGCVNLRVWDMALCQEVSLEGWQAIALYCAELQFLDVHRCRQFCGRSMLAIQESCPSLRCIHVTSCPRLLPESCNRFQMSRPDVQLDTRGALTHCCHMYKNVGGCDSFL